MDTIIEDGHARKITKTRALGADEEADVRALLDRSFGGDFEETDWAHTVHGVYYLLRIDGRIVAHAAVVARTIWVDETRFRAAYIEAVAVDPGLQGRGLGTQVMRAIEPELDAFDLGVLSTGEHAFYERLGWERWKGPTWVRSTEGDVRTPDEDNGIMIRRTPKTARLSVSSAIMCEARAGDDW